MSLLEDVFLQDEAGEAQELERIIEGDEDDERPRQVSDSDENSEKEDEAEEDKRRVDPSKAKTTRIVKNPRFILNPARLNGPRGIQAIPDHFKDFKFKGKGHEVEDLDMALKKLEHWAYRLYPKFQFDDCLKKIETLGKKRPVMVHLHKIRSGQYLSEETVVQKDSSDDEAPEVPQEEDEFDKLLQQQIELARATPAPGSVKKGFQTPGSLDKRSPLMMPKATSSPSISDEQRERMLRNRKLAEERRLARLKQIDVSIPTITENTANNNEVTILNDSASKRNRSNVIDSSDEETEAKTTDQSVVVDVHAKKPNALMDVTENVHTVTETRNGEDVTTLNDSASKWNRPNVIDSSDEETKTTTDQCVVVDVHAKSANVDVTEHVRTIIENATNADAVTTANDRSGNKRNRSNIIDSSDEDTEMTTVYQSIAVDIHAKSPNTNVVIDEIESTIDKGVPIVDLVGVIDITNVVGLVGPSNSESHKNTEKVIDITNVEVRSDAPKRIIGSVDLIDDGEELKVKNHNRSAVIDSSDEECGITSVQEGVLVDVHDNLLFDSNSKDSANDIRLENDSETIPPKSNSKHEESKNTKSHTNDIVVENNETEESSSDKGKNNDVLEILSNKENVDTNVDIDYIMDVDFSEEF